MTERLAATLQLRYLDTFAARLRGLIGYPPLLRDQAVLLRPCRGVHTCFLSWPIDVVFLDAQGRMLHTVPGLRPWRWAGCAAAFQVLELPAGAVAGTPDLQGRVYRALHALVG